MAERMHVPVDVSLGLNLVDPHAALDPGELIRAKNLRAGVWGPRHGNSYVDRANRGRVSLSLNGSTGFATIPYISEQLDLGVSFSMDFLIDITTLPSVNPAWLWGNDDATDRSVDLYLNTDGTISAYVEDSNGTTTTLTSTTTFAADDVVAIRIYRVGSTCRLYCDTVLEDSSTDLNASYVTAVVADDRLVGKPPGYATGEYFNGVIGFILIRSFGDTDFSYAYAEFPGPRGGEVLGCWTEVLTVVASDDTLHDASRFGNHAILSNAVQGSRVPELIEPVQAIRSVVMRDGRAYNVVLAGGRLYTVVV